MQKRADGNTRVRVNLAHDFRETIQVFDLLLDGADSCGPSLESVQVHFGWRKEFLVGLLQILNDRFLVRLRIVNQTAEFIEALLPEPMENNVDRGALFTNKQNPFTAAAIIC